MHGIPAFFALRAACSSPSTMLHPALCANLQASGSILQTRANPTPQMPSHNCCSLLLLKWRLSLPAGDRWVHSRAPTVGRPGGRQQQVVLALAGRRRPTDPVPQRWWQGRPSVAKPEPKPQRSSPSPSRWWQGTPAAAPQPKPKSRTLKPEPEPKPKPKTYEELLERKQTRDIFQACFLSAAAFLTVAVTWTDSPSGSGSGSGGDGQAAQLCHCPPQQYYPYYYYWSPSSQGDFIFLFCLFAIFTWLAFLSLAPRRT